MNFQFRDFKKLKIHPNSGLMCIRIKKYSLYLTEFNKFISLAKNLIYNVRY